MFETAKKYSEDRYYRKEDLGLVLDRIVLDAVWKEVQSYRDMFRFDIPIGKQRFYFVMNPNVSGKLLNLQQLCFSYLMKHKDENEFAINATCLSEEDIARLQTLFHQQNTSSIANRKLWYERCIQLFHLDTMMNIDIFHVLLDEQISFFIKFYLLRMIEDERCSHILCYCLLAEYRMLLLKDIFFAQGGELIFSQINKEQDLTYYFLQFLNKIWLKLSDLMLLLNSHQQESTLTLQTQELLERYPALTNEQILFFVEHRTCGHYYTISNYMEFCSVCYETARYSLDKLVNMRWYQKQKMGKKFVYFIM